MVVGGDGLHRAATVLFNLISDLTGGVRVTVIEEETARPGDPRPDRRVASQSSPERYA